MLNCKVCILAHMLQHPELLFWKKCPSCGYCQFDSDAHARHPKASKLATYRMQSGQEIPQVDKSEEPDSATSSHKE